MYASTKRPATRELIGRLRDTFLQQNQGSGGPYDWNWNNYNDDLLWRIRRGGDAADVGAPIAGPLPFSAVVCPSEECPFARTELVRPRRRWR